MKPLLILSEDRMMLEVFQKDRYDLMLEIITNNYERLIYVDGISPT